MAAIRAVVAAVVLGSLRVAAVPSPQSVGGDVSILTHNDLYGNASTRQAAALVLGASLPHAKAQQACQAFGESLWSPPSSNLGFLEYLDYLAPQANANLHWIGSNSSSHCRAVDAYGRMHAASCNATLPALCSQSAALSSPASVDTSAKWQTAVKTGNATITGYRDKVSFRFQGIKFASPARFAYAEYQAPTGSIPALAYGPGCLQGACTTTACSEDCLFLNIWTPSLPARPSKKNKKAVLFWIYGGGFVSGFGSDTTFDGGSLASRGDVVVVTINYRLGNLGFLALNNSTLKGNYWLSDEIAALDWVRNHIEDFGGDKDRITVFGQSAGAASVRALLATPLAKGKFSGAIVQSCPGGVGYAKSFSEYYSPADASSAAQPVLATTNCTQTDPLQQLACLRALSAATISGTSTQVSYPVVDGTYLQTSHLQLNGNGPSLDVVVLVGSMHDDGDPFISFPTTSDLGQALDAQGYNGTAIADSGLFPVPQTSNSTLDVFNATSRVATDASFRCLTQSTAYSAALNKVFPKVYSYEFERAYQLQGYSPNPPTCEAPITAAFPFGDPSQPFFKCHSGDLYYVFGNIVREGRPIRDANDIPFSQYIVDTWAAFAREGTPNPSKGFLDARGFTNTSALVAQSPVWDPVDPGKPQLRALNVEPEDVAFEDVAQCNLLQFPLEYYAQ